MLEQFEVIKDQLLEDYSLFVVILFKMVVATILLVIFWFIGNRVNQISNKKLGRRLQDPLLASFIGGVFRFIIFLMGLMLIFRVFGWTNLVSGMLAGAGLTAFIVGFALKDIGENFLAGILLAFKRPFRVGDTIEIAGLRGRIKALNLRDTLLKTPDGKDIYLPNSIIVKNPLTNFTIDGYLRHEFTVILSQQDDCFQAMAIMEKAIVNIAGVLDGSRAPSLFVGGLAGNKVNVIIHFWVDTFDRRTPDHLVKSNAIVLVLQALKEAGITTG
ncbi:mechanosensitive ion channel family protein [Pararhodonellum marinum]|uniref:mechanosensitive ion channel family protein n=1 Tax=Pararhodonellum marinum TaxID=2755358 RepID=UPI00188DD138|nr:mechanosensitive ion channel family protein [Pararhodonellum marinum]